MRTPTALLLALASLMAGCDMLGIESATAVAAKREAEGKAIGSACRHAGRAIEDCYTLNKKADKGAVFAGWREMNDYMRENKLEEVAPQLPAAGAAKPAAKADEDEADTDDTHATPSKAASKTPPKPARAGDAKADPKADAKAAKPKAH